MNAILLLDKPLGLSSNQALQRVRALFNHAKAGHAGTLDPLATGMLPICFNKATRINQFLLNYKKCYQADIQLGITTDTGDKQGTITSQRAYQHINHNQLKQVLQRQRGQIWQTPPQYCALKYRGKPMYQYARQGIQVPKSNRLIEIHQLDLLSFNEGVVGIKVVCSKGTYIRSLSTSIGDQLGCGAHLISLRRLWSEPFNNYGMWPLQELLEMTGQERQQTLLKTASALTKLPSCQLAEEQRQAYLFGQKIDLRYVHPAFNTADDADCNYVAVYTNQQLLGLAELNENGLHPRLLMIDSNH